ncbi:MAG: transketolase [Synergistaceae bacterium]|jgi:transketolase|nr:transketolase [Synergistaceae bacterium]
MSVPKRSLGEAYKDALLSLAGSHSNLFVLDADLGLFREESEFGRRHPDRYLNIGAAEQNLILTAAGMSIAGMCVYASACSSFLTGRAYEQIRSAVALPGLAVHLVGSHAGITVGEDGAIYQMLEDVALMRALHGVALLVPSDYTSAYALCRQVADMKGPSYIRLGLPEQPLIYSPDDSDFRVGDGRILREGDQITICACGIMVGEALKAAEVLDQQDIGAEVIDCYCLNPFPARLVLSSLQRTGCCVTAEEHFLPGGLFELVAGLAAREYPVPVQPVGVKIDFGQSGSAEDLKEFYGLTADQIVSASVLAWTMRRR